MRQEYQRYTKEDQRVWRTLFERQVQNLTDKACQEYLDCLEKLHSALYADAIPKFDELNEILRATHNWSIIVVPGLIPVVEFFELLAKRKFCSSTWLRNPEQLDYLEEPDMFHDIFGHIPLFMDENYADYVQKVGELGIKYRNNPLIIRQLQRLYWFTIEFGLVNTHSKENFIYGAGILSSYGETNHVFHDEINIYPYDIITIMDQEFTTSEIQTQYFEIEGFEQLFASLEKVELLATNR